MIQKLLTLLCFLLLVASQAFAFPDNGVLDTFTGADDTTPPNANWTNAPLQGATSANVRIRGNGVTTATSSTEADAYWDTTSFGAACEAYAKLVTPAAGITFGAVYCRLANIGANTTDGYAVYVEIAATDVCIYRIDNGSSGTALACYNQTFAANDQFGIRTVGSNICAWYKAAAGSWAELGCVIDGTYSDGGFIGLSIIGSNTDGDIDDFGGGDVASAVPPTRRRAF